MVSNGIATKTRKLNVYYPTLPGTGAFHVLKLWEGTTLRVVEHSTIGPGLTLNPDTHAFTSEWCSPNPRTHIPSESERERGSLSAADGGVQCTAPRRAPAQPRCVPAHPVYLARTSRQVTRPSCAAAATETVQLNNMGGMGPVWCVDSGGIPLTAKNMSSMPSRRQCVRIRRGTFDDPVLVTSREPFEFAAPVLKEQADVLLMQVRAQLAS